jgi:hypothetical protein
MAKSTYAFYDMSYLIIVIVFLLIVIFASTYYINGNSMLENFVANKNYSIEYYYMKGCSHCEKFNNTGIWEELEKTYGKSIKFNKYENRENPDKVKKYDITGFPTIIIISNEKIVEEYNGNRSKDDLEKFIKRYI